MSAPMLIGERVRKLRKEKKLSQGDIEKRTGLLCAHISIVENGYITPTIQTLERIAHALEVPLQRLFYDSNKPPKALNLKWQSPEETGWGSAGKDAKFLNKLSRLLSEIGEEDRRLILLMARKMVGRG
jgi:transcriptional regulator with XRE-family HTH domain